MNPWLADNSLSPKSRVSDRRKAVPGFATCSAGVGSGIVHGHRGGFIGLSAPTDDRALNISVSVFSCRDGHKLVLGKIPLKSSRAVLDPLAVVVSHAITFVTLVIAL